MVKQKCRECCRDISAEEYNKNNGYCNNCYAEKQKTTVQDLKSFLLKHKKLFIIISCIILVIIISYFVDNEIKIYNKVKYAMSFIEEDYDYEKFEKQIKNENKKVVIRAYTELYNYCLEQSNNLKGENEDCKLLILLNDINESKLIEIKGEKRDSVKKQFSELKSDVSQYMDLYKIKKNINIEEYINSYEKLNTITENTKNDDIKRIAIDLRDSIREQAIKEVVKESQDLIEEEKYLEAYNELNSKKYYYAELENARINMMNKIRDKAISQAMKEAKAEEEKNNIQSAINILKNFDEANNSEIKSYKNTLNDKLHIQNREKEKFDFEIYCYFNMLAWKEMNTITDDKAYSKCAKKFGITKEQAEESYHRVESTSWEYQSKYPDIYDKYASQYYK